MHVQSCCTKQTMSSLWSWSQLLKLTNLRPLPHLFPSYFKVWIRGCQIINFVWCLSDELITTLFATTVQKELKYRQGKMNPRESPVKHVKAPKRVQHKFFDKSFKKFILRTNLQSVFPHEASFQVFFFFFLNETNRFHFSLELLCRYISYFRPKIQPYCHFSLIR